MATVTDNYRGYDESDLTNRVTNFRDKKLLLIHGTADKLVHYQHSMLLVRAFAEKGVLFRHMVRTVMSKIIVYNNVLLYPCYPFLCVLDSLMYLEK